MRPLFRETLASVKRSPLLTGLSISMISLALYILGLFVLAVHNFYLALDEMEERIQVVAYIQDTATPEHILDLRRILTSMPEVKGVEFVTKAEALQRANRELPEFRDIFSNLENNPLPASLEIQLAPDSRTPEGTLNVVGTISSHPIVEGVEYGQEWVDTFFALSRIAGAASLLFGAAFAVAASLIIGTTMKIAVLARKQEIEIMQLVGARDRSILFPFLAEGAFTGMSGGILGTVLTYVTVKLMSQYVFTVNWIPNSWVLIGIAATITLGVITSGFSVRRQLKEISP